MAGVGIDNGIQVGRDIGVGFIDEYQAVYDSWTTKPSGEVAIAQNVMVEFFVSTGVWAKWDVFYVFAAHTNANGEALTNWINPGTFDVTLVPGAWSITFTAFEGFQTTGNAYVDTNYAPITDAINFGLNDASLSFYSRTNGGTGIDLGIAGHPNYVTLGASFGGNFRAGLNSLPLSYAVADSLGMFVASRSDNANINFFKNKVLNTIAGVSGAIPVGTSYIFARHTNDSFAELHSNRQGSCASFGSSMSQQNVDDYTDGFETYMDSNGKGVIS